MKSTLIFLIAVLSIGFAGCSDDSSTNSNRSLIRVSGQVLVIGCGPNCPWGNCWETVPYTAGTGRVAWVTLQRDDGFRSVAETDQVSRVTFDIDTGTYHLIVATFHMPPTQVGTLHLTHDTSGIQFYSHFTYDPPDSLAATFYLGPDDPVFSERQERGYLALLNQRLRGALDYSAMTRRVTEFDGFRWVYYEDIGIRPDIPAWQMEEKIKDLRSADSTLFPHQLSVTGYVKICLQQ